MSDMTIDRLQIKVEADATKASKSLDALVASLNKVKTSTGASADGLEKLSATMSTLAETAGKFASGDLSGIQKMADSLGALKDVRSFAPTKRTLENFAKLRDTMESLGRDGRDVDLRNLAKPLHDLSKIKIEAKGINRLKELPKIINAYKELDISSFTSQIDKLTQSLIPLADAVGKVGGVWDNLPRSIKTAGSAARTVAAANRNLAAGAVDTANKGGLIARGWAGLTGMFNSVHMKYLALMGALQFGKQTIGAAISQSNKYVEDMNLFSASMGKYADSAERFAAQAQELLGIDMGQWARNQGIFMTLSTGFGIAADKASVMSQNLTQLGYDISSFFNIPVEDAFLKLQSGLAGELEPLRRLGWDLSVARLQLEATKLGIDANVNSMTQAEKAALRYYAIMTQVTTAHGDMAATIDSPANQLRVLQMQFIVCSRAIGNLFIPALNAIIPVVIAVIQTITYLANCLASLFGADNYFQADMSGLDTSGIAAGFGDAADAADDMASGLGGVGKAAKGAKDKIDDLKTATVGIDKLNIIDKPKEDTGGSGGGGGGGRGGGGGGMPKNRFKFPLPTYNMFDRLKKKADNLFKTIKRHLDVILPLITGIGAAFATWKISNAIMRNMDKIRKFAERFKKTPVARMLTGAGAATAGAAGTVKDAKKDKGKKGKKAKKDKKAHDLDLPVMATGGSGKEAKGKKFFSTRIKALRESEKLKKAATSTGFAFGAIAGSIALVTAHFTRLMMCSDNFRRGLALVGRAADSFGKGVGQVFSGVIKLAGHLAKALGLEKPFNDAKAACAEFFKAFQLGWTDAAMVGGAALAALVGFVNPVGFAVAGVLGGVELLTLGLRWMGERGTRSFDMLKGVSEETKEKLQDLPDVANDVATQVELAQIGAKFVTDADVAHAADNARKIGDSIRELVQQQQDADMAHLETLRRAGAITEQEYQRRKQALEAYYKTQLKKTEEHEDAITSLFARASAEHRSITADEAQEITNHFTDLALTRAKLAGANEEELKAIEEGIKNNTIAQSDEAVKRAVEGIRQRKEELKKLAEEEANNQLKIIEGERSLGIITQEEADKRTQAIKDSLEESKKELDKKTDEEVEIVKQKTGEMVDRYDWATGERKTQGEELLSSTKTWAEEQLKAWNDSCDKTKKSHSTAMRNMSKAGEGFASDAKSQMDGVKRHTSEKSNEAKNAYRDAMADCSRATDNMADNVRDQSKKFPSWFEDATAGMKRAWSGVQNFIDNNPILGTIKTAIVGSGDHGGGHRRFASGGFPSVGEMFIAREAGPELVGRIGRRTAVANNNQIVAGIQSGVSEAMSAQNAILLEQNNLLRSLLAKDSGGVSVQLDGRELSRSVDRYNHYGRGAQIATGAIY